MAGTFTGIARGVGELGSQLGTAADYLARMRVKAAQDALNQQLAQVQLAESQARLKEIQQKLTGVQPYGTATMPGGGTEGITFDPKTGTFQHQSIIPNQPPFSDQELTDLLSGFPEATRGPLKTLAQQYEKQYGRGPTVQELLKEYAGMQKKSANVPASQLNKPVLVNGVPVGIVRQDGVHYETSPDWTAQDAADLAGFKKTFTEGEAAKSARQQAAERARMSYLGQTRAYGVVDKTTGELEEITANQLAANPGKYAPAGPAVTAKNRQVLFGEIDYTTGQLEKAIAKMGDEGFDTASRLQLAIVLRSGSAPGDVSSAWNAFLTSEAAGTLTPKQVDYVTGLVSLEESAMSLRSIAGMGQGSDMLRAAISRMLPGAGTPSRAYANRQLELFKGEVNALRKSVPGTFNRTDENQTGGDQLNKILDDILGPPPKKP